MHLTNSWWLSSREPRLKVCARCVHAPAFALCNPLTALTIAFSSVLATGRSEAQQQELDNLRGQNRTFSNDVRLNSIRQGADGEDANKMALLQFAATLQASQAKQEVKDEVKQEGSSSGTFDPAKMAAAMWGGGGGGPARLGYGGEGSGEAWKTEQKAEKKRKREEKKAKRAERDKKKTAKISNLINEHGFTFEQASAAVQDLYASEESEKDDSD